MDQSFRQDLDELIKTGKAADRVDRERADALATLVKQPGWIEFQKILAALVQARGEQMMKPAGSIDGAIGLEYVKGTMNGLLMAQNLPDFIMAAMKPTGPATDEGDDDEE